MVYLIVTVLYNVVHIIVSVVGRLFGKGKRTWTELGATGLFLVIIFLVTIIGLIIGAMLRDRGYRAIVAHSQPLLAAIKQYQDKTGKPPDRLDALVPDYLPAIPDTGAGAYPNYEFITNASPTQYAGNRWVLSVDVSTDDLTRDQLIYYPDRNYPSKPQVAIARRFGDWAFLSTVRPK
jgi:hypothetical protein